ncbi:MAG TPA: ABC transporter ATP-binding protein [Thermoplasmata archaeon]|nr:ABC transporter ATP-binding protein [Thermoplasmata archaeon]
MANAIEVQGLVKSYGPLRAVDGIDFAVPSGRVFAFLGPNGAGKTTTVEILEGLRNRTGGTVRVLGLDPWKDGAEVHRRIGVIPQEFRFFEKIHPREALEYYGTLFDTDVDPIRLLKRVYLEDKADANFDTLSGGQKQKLGLALSLVSNPEICFLDEPTTGLDPQARRGIWEVIQDLRAEGRTVFLTTHYLEEAELLADEVAIISHGKIIVRGPPAEIVANHGRPDRLRFEAGPELATVVRRDVGVPVTVSDHHVDVEIAQKGDARRVFDALERNKQAWDRFTVERDTLEDVFVRMVGRMDDGVLKSEGTA